MDMDHLIGQRFNLISKSEIRYVGTLHEINPEDSTIALEDVYSFGTEDRPAKSFIPPSQQKFDYIVFRGGDVKDIKIAEDQKENKQPSPPSVPNDPAILNSSRPGPPPGRQAPPPRDQSPFHPPGYPPQPDFGGYYPPQHYGRGFGPPPPGNFGPNPNFQGMPYGPPPPGYYGPPGQGFLQGPGQFHQPPPIGSPSQGPAPPQMQRQQMPSSAPEPDSGSKTTSELPVDSKAAAKSTGPNTAPAPPVNPTPGTLDAKDFSSEALPVQPTQASSSKPSTTTVPQPATKAPPTGPKNNRVLPAVPMTVNQKSFIPSIPASMNGPLSSSAGNTTVPSTKTVPTQAAMEAASRQAKEAVAAAMAKLQPQTVAAAPKPTASAPSMDILTKKLSEIKTTTDGTSRGRGGFRGGRGGFNRNGSGGHPAGRKIEIPKSDYDFESANAKFNKEDMMKEAIATGSPIGDVSDNGTNGETELEQETSNGDKRRDSLTASTERAYDKSSSFFDNISSEAKDREDTAEGGRGRGARGEEFKKNIETFGQGNVDGGYRGRGRGGFGRGRGYGGSHRGYGGNRGVGRGATGGFRGRAKGGAFDAATAS